MAQPCFVITSTEKKWAYRRLQVRSQWLSKRSRRWLFLPKKVFIKRLDFFEGVQIKCFSRKDECNDFHTFYTWILYRARWCSVFFALRVLATSDSTRDPYSARFPSQTEHHCHWYRWSKINECLCMFGWSIFCTLQLWYFCHQSQTFEFPKIQGPFPPRSINIQDPSEIHYVLSSLSAIKSSEYFSSFRLIDFFCAPIMVIFVISHTFEFHKIQAPSPQDWEGNLSLRCDAARAA